MLGSTSIYIHKYTYIYIYIYIIYIYIYTRLALLDLFCKTGNCLISYYSCGTNVKLEGREIQKQKESK